MSDLQQLGYTMITAPLLLLFLVSANWIALRVFYYGFHWYFILPLIAPFLLGLALIV